MNAPHASIHPIAPDTWRISVAMPPELFPGGFSFNQYLVVDERPLLFHTGPKKLFGLVRQQIEKVMPLERLRYIAFSHVEADECGALADFLALAPDAQPVCGRVGAMVDVNDMVDVPPLVMQDGQVLDLGTHELVWQSTPHLPHGWECGYMHDRTTGTLFCGDLFTQPGTGEEPIVTRDILGPSEAFRQQDDYFSHSRNAPALIEKLARLEPSVLACMHGSAWKGDGGAMLRSLGAALAA
ncbi:MBL fold metallo-hydrolase [Ramlibacter sp. Leaf400]|uniref:MBL fold metallo-hydrolase n=1 Tax=Ramlibacter sp. Leaf400 TaxID=1736365 RepID=UPI0006F8B655|nr:MBL fold metallo-hydrolase [Ramlibacter sp. Leaf400]KQT10931.1 MBL fold metallo-hydrolase [Ramlibacter sp. Leaf400]